MYPIYHFILTVILSGFLWPILGWKLALFWLGAFFIDVDHYWWYIIKFKRFSLRESYFYSKDYRNINKNKLNIFHTVEFWILMGIWSIFFNLAFVIFLGIVFHINIDFIDAIIKNKWRRVFSFFEWIYST